MAWLVAVDGELKGRRFPLGSPCLVGRGPYNHVVLDDTRISRQHAKISPEQSGHVVYDLNSANGTFVNEVQVKRHKLRPNDVIRFGPFRFLFEAALDEPAAMPRGGSDDKFVEVLTFVGSGQPSAILDSLDAKLASDVRPAGLQALEEADRKLRTLYGFLQSISTTLDTEELLDRIVENVLEVFPQASGAIAYLPNGEVMEPRKRRSRDPSRPLGSATLPPQFYEEVVAKGKATLSAARATIPRAGATRGELSLHAPMLFDDQVHGVLHVRGSEGEGSGFNQRDLDLLTGLAAQAAVSLQNAQMHQESLKQQRLQQDLLLAEQIQKSFLPATLPSVEGLEFATDYRPAYSVGGDFYDVFWLTHDRIAVFIGDVSGKGVSAALLMARVSSDLRMAAASEPSPARVLSAVNQMVLQRAQTDTFVTAVFLTLDVHSGAVTIATAGHPPPLVRRQAIGCLERIEEGGGTALGIFEETEFSEIDVELGPGDALVLYTDGVTEAVSPTGEHYGLARLEKTARMASSRPKELAERVQKDLRAHVGQAPQADDLTLIVCGVTGRMSGGRRRRLEDTTEVEAIKSKK